VKAAVYHRFGSPDVLELQDVAQPALTDDGVLVRVRASSVNPAEWFAETGRPYIARPAMGAAPTKADGPRGRLRRDRRRRWQRRHRPATR
jgi:NADPH:quinone reductase-like Zn-dependent oxidoreductase